MGLIHEAKKGGWYDSSFVLTPKARDKIEMQRAADNKGHKWFSFSGEGIRFAYTERQIRSVGGHLAEVTLFIELQTLQDQRLEEISEIKNEAAEEV